MALTVTKIGEAIFVYRKHAGMSIEQLALESETSFSHISRIERGLIANPGLYSIKKILKSLNCKLLIVYKETKEEKKIHQKATIRKIISEGADKE